MSAPTDPRTHALLEAPIAPTLLRLAAPNVLVLVAQASAGLVEAYFIGRLGTTLGEAGVNIGTFHLGRREAGGEAVALVSVDGHIADEVLRKLEAIPGVRRVKPLRF